jgi:hypothetical protein
MNQSTFDRLMGLEFLYQKSLLDRDVIFHFMKRSITAKISWVLYDQASRAISTG